MEIGQGVTFESNLQTCLRNFYANDNVMNDK